MGMSADELKLAPITAMSSSSTRAKDWEDVLTAHADEQGARTWRVLDSRIGAWVLEMEQGAVQVRTPVLAGRGGD
jgi:U3 small nucleolar RNA-associated protein 21